MKLHSMPRTQGKTEHLRHAVAAAHRAQTPIGLAFKGGVLMVPPGYTLELATEAGVELRCPAGGLLRYRAKPRS